MVGVRVVVGVGVGLGWGCGWGWGGVVVAVGVEPRRGLNLVSRLGVRLGVGVACVRIHRC